METAPDLWHSLLDCSNSESTLVVCLCGGGSTSCVHPASLTWICYIKVKSDLVEEVVGWQSLMPTRHCPIDTDTHSGHGLQLSLCAYYPAAVRWHSRQMTIYQSVCLFVVCFFFTLELSMVLTFTAAKKSIRPPQKSPHTQRLTHTTIERHTHILHTFFLWEPENYLCLSLNLNHYSYSIRLSLRLILTVTTTLSLF